MSQKRKECTDCPNDVPKGKQLGMAMRQSGDEFYLPRPLSYSHILTSYPTHSQQG